MKKIALALVVVLLIAAGATGWWWARASLPVLDGQLTLPGLRAPVEVLLDDYGVPSVYAADTDDAWFTAGVLHARERLWQMELYRRVTMGRLSEVMGERTLAIDERFLTLGLRAAAEAEWQRATPTVKTALERYAEGVNAIASPPAPARDADPGHHAGAVDAGGLAVGRPAAGVAPGRESPGGIGARRAGGEIWRRGGAAAGGAISSGCAGDYSADAVDGVCVGCVWRVTGRG
jgi:hypothetical protein